MEISDVTQATRRVRALLSADDVRRALAHRVAQDSGLDLMAPDVTIEACTLLTPAPGSPAAEVILVVNPARPAVAQVVR